MGQGAAGNKADADNSPNGGGGVNYCYYCGGNNAIAMDTGESRQSR
jgi:uncharacterized protein YcbK (DUF882 family)